MNLSTKQKQTHRLREWIFFFYAKHPDCWVFFFYIHLFIYLFIYGCVGSSFLCEGFLQLWQAGATLHRGVRASHCCGLSCCGAQAPDVQAQQLWLAGPVALRHVGSSQTRARARVLCIGRQTLNHCATRETPREWTYSYQGARVGGGIDWEFETDMYTLLYLK